MQAFINWMNGRSRLVKLLFCLPVIDIIWGVYRVLGAIADKNWLRLVLGILWIVFGGFVGWILDILAVIIVGHIFWWQD